ncbi:MAG: hypothetical protein IJ761_06685 [Bacteroidales bacterium]|nr:hypothetical protein [Bacteroidales bacterium]
MPTPVSFEQIEPLGISHEVYDEMTSITGHLPTMEEVTTLLAMWQSNGQQQSLYSWLRGQTHAVVRDDYLYDGHEENRAIAEPKVKECVGLAQQLCKDVQVCAEGERLPTGALIYLVGNVGREFVNSAYSRSCLHLVSTHDDAVAPDVDCQYVGMIVQTMVAKGLLIKYREVATGGLFCGALGLTAPLGFDILAPREVRLDAFLFGEQQGRYLVALSVQQDDTFLQKMAEARLNCCFLGRTTQNRIVVDGFDFGRVDRYVSSK